MVINIMIILNIFLVIFAKGHPLADTHQQNHQATPEMMQYDSNSIAESDSDSAAELLKTVFIAVTTTGRYHVSRLGSILDTWYPSLASQTWFFTDTPDPSLAAAMASRGGPGDVHLVVLQHCGVDHSRAALACKMEAQLATFLQMSPSDEDVGRTSLDWFCHLDDDNYLNGRALAALLAAYDGRQEDWYLGKASIPEPLELPPGPPAAAGNTIDPTSRQRFLFATGGAGFCLSRHLAERMRPWVEGGRFRRLADTIRLPDDVTVGYLVEVLLGGRLTPVADLHSHLEPLQGLVTTDPRGLLARAVTLSYGRYEDTGAANVAEVEGPEGWSSEEKRADWTRFYAVHCHLNPSECRRPSDWRLT